MATPGSEPPAADTHTLARALRLAFISHHHEDRAVAAEVASSLQAFGLTGFIAHRDLQQGAEWIEEIKRSLREAAVLVAVLTPKFLTSNWTDQEVGFAVGRDVPIIPIDAGSTPYGFMAGIQAVRWGNAGTEGGLYGVTGMEWTREQLTDRLFRLGNALVLRKVLERRDLLHALSESGSWNTTTALVRLLDPPEGWTPEETLSLARVAVENRDIYDSYGARDSLQAVFTRFRDRLEPELRAELIRSNLLAE